jgi:hypothetical protein
MALQDSIEAARQVLPFCWFNEERTYEGLEHLRAYSRTWDEKTSSFKDRPNHDAHSHAADAFRYMALSSGKIAEMGLLTGGENSEINRQTYGFSLDQLWDSQPKASQRIG